MHAFAYLTPGDCAIEHTAAKSLATRSWFSVKFLRINWHKHKRAKSIAQFTLSHQASPFWGPVLIVSDFLLSALNSSRVRIVNHVVAISRKAKVNDLSSKHKALEILINRFFPRRRMDTDVIKLIESKHEVTLLGSNLNEFCVKFYGPRGEFWHHDAACQSLSWVAFSCVSTKLSPSATNHSLF